MTAPPLVTSVENVLAGTTRRVAALEAVPRYGLIAVKLFADDEVVTAGIRWIIGITEADQLAGSSLVQVGTYVSTVSSSGNVKLQLENLTSGNPMLSTSVSINQSDKFSDNAATPYVIDPANALISLHDEIAYDVTDAGNGTMGLLAVLRFS